MVTAEELVVSITSDGTQETQDDLEGVEESMENTADSAEGSAEELEGFSQRFQGALSAAVAALAVGAAGLLSQVPVIGEAMAGLFAIVEALAFQMDSVLRPVLTPIGDFFFEVANAIFEADGAMGTLIGGVTSFLSIAAVVITTVAAIGSVLGVWASTTGGVISILGTLGSVVAGLLSTLAGLVSLPAVIIGAIVAFAAAYALNLRGVRDTTNEIVGTIVDTVVGGFLSLASRALDALGDFASGVRSTLTDVAARMASWAGDLASDAFGWGRSIITRFVTGIESMLGAIRQVLEDLPFIGRILDLFDRLSDAIGELDFDSDVSASLGANVFANGGGGGGGGGGGASTGRPRFGAGGGASTGGQQIDGRQISESTGRYRSDPANRRGL